MRLPITVASFPPLFFQAHRSDSCQWPVCLGKLSFGNAKTRRLQRMRRFLESWLGYKEHHVRQGLRDHLPRELWVNMWCLHLTLLHQCGENQVRMLRVNQIPLPLKFAGEVGQPEPVAGPLGFSLCGEFHNGSCGHS